MAITDVAALLTARRNSAEPRRGRRTAGPARDRSRGAARRVVAVAQVVIEPAFAIDLEAALAIIPAALGHHHSPWLDDRRASTRLWPEKRPGGERRS
jgi:hypothetical protein